MTGFVELAAGNLLSPMILFFVLGFAAALLRSDLQIPEAIGKALSIYLLLSIGLKGGAAMSAAGFDDTFLGAIAVAIVLSFAMPALGFGLLRLSTGLDRPTAAAVAAHYGSVSAVTFVTAVGFLSLRGVPHETYMVAIMALMETPAIITGLLLAHRGDARHPGTLTGRGRGDLIREIALNGSVVVLVGAFAIGWITGEAGMAKVSPFVIEPFLGVLCLFLLDMGLIAGRQLRNASGLGTGAILFALYMPLIGAALGMLGGTLVGLSPGGTGLLAVLAASASYIAVPAAMRIALPAANPAVYLTLSLAITFPFNVIIGIPLYFSVVMMLYGG